MTDSKGGVWELRVITGDGVSTVYGCHELMDTQYREIKEAINALDGTSERPTAIEIQGYTNTCDRADALALVLVDSITTITLTRY